jgi:hypothetical protein
VYIPPVGVLKHQVRTDRQEGEFSSPDERRLAVIISYGLMTCNHVLSPISRTTVARSPSRSLHCNRDSVARRRRLGSTGFSDRP